KVIPADEFSLERAVEYGTAEQNAAVKQIIDDVRADGDAALRRYSEVHDRVQVGALRVEESELQAAYGQVEPAFLTALRQAAANIREFHERQKRQTWVDLQPNGTMVGQHLRPLKRVGVYVPGGKAAY